MSKEELSANLTEVTDLLYQQKIKEGYEKLPTVLAELGNYIATMEDASMQQEILESLNEALDAMQQKDYTLLADLLQYELLEKL